MKTLMKIAGVSDLNKGRSDTLRKLREKYQNTRSANVAGDIDDRIADIHAQDIGKQTGLSGRLRSIIGKLTSARSSP